MAVGPHHLRPNTLDRQQDGQEEGELLTSRRPRCHVRAPAGKDPVQPMFLLPVFASPQNRTQHNNGPKANFGAFFSQFGEDAETEPLKEQTRCEDFWLFATLHFARHRTTATVSRPPLSTSTLPLVE